MRLCYRFFSDVSNDEMKCYRIENFKLIAVGKGPQMPLESISTVARVVRRIEARSLIGDPSTAFSERVSVGMGAQLRN